MAGKRKKNTEPTNREKAKSTKAVERQYRRLERSSKFWNKVDPANKFRHWYLGAASITRSLFRVAAAWQTIVILLSILVILYIMAAFYTGRGEFVVKLDRPMADGGWLLSETPDFSERLITLRNDAVEDVTNITLEDIPKDVMDVDGKHNGRDYVAYTFYVKNCTGATQNYQYQLALKSSSNGVETATWVMLFQNGKQKIYAQKNQAGYAECTYRRFEVPFAEYAKDAEYMLSTVKEPDKAHVTEEMKEYHDFDQIAGLYQLQTYPWSKDDIVCQDIRKKIKDQGVDKYTVVIWLEGDDPDCTDDLFGGHVEMNMMFSTVEEE